MATYVYTANRNELLIDDDTGKLDTKEIANLLKLACCDSKSIKVYPSRTAGHQHIHIVLYKFFPTMQRIALQALLGSDPKREALSIDSLWHKENAITIFTNIKWENKEPASFCECTSPNKNGEYCQHVKPFTHRMDEYEESDRQRKK